MEPSNEQNTYIVANTYSSGDTVVIDGYRYHCNSRGTYPMQLIGYGHVGGYPYNNSIQKWNDLAKIRTVK